MPPALVLSVLFVVAATAAPPLPTITMPAITGIATVGAAESVFDWKTQHCATGRPLAPCHPAPCHATPYRRDVPDAPAMAWRDPVSNLTFVAPGDSRGTWPSIGHGLDAVKHDCSEMIFNYSGPSGYNQPPWTPLESASMFSSHEWLYAPWVVPPTPGSGKNATVYMLVHNEFHGFEHSPQLCNATTMIHGRCWYNSVSMSVSHDGGRHIEHVAPPPHHLVAAAATKYVPNNGAYGVFSPSQIVSYKGWLYSFPRFATQDRPQGTAGGGGVTIMRIQEKDLNDPTKWRFWTGPESAGGAGEGAFTGQSTNPYTQAAGGASPAAICFGPSPTNTSKPGACDHPQPSQAVPRYLPAHDMFLMTGYSNMPSGHGAGGHFGFSTAKFPWGPWTAMQPISGVDVNPAKDPTQVRGLYPSLLDPNSPSLTYETIEGDTAYVYWVQGRDKTVVGAPDMARDLWRQKVKISFNDTLENPPPTPPPAVAAWDHVQGNGGGDNGGAAATSVCDVTVAPYGAIGDNRTEDTAAVQRALDDSTCSTVLLPSGRTFLLRPIELRSHRALVVDGNIAAWRTITTWPNSTTKNCSTVPYQSNVTHSAPQRESLLYAAKLSNFTLSGKGTIEGHGWNWWPLASRSDYWHHCRPKLIHVGTVDSAQDGAAVDITLTGVTLANSPFWTVAVRGAKRLRIQDVHVTTTAFCGYAESPNTDGFNLQGDDILIEDSTVRNGDDCTPIFPPSNNITIRNVSCECGNGITLAVWPNFSRPGHGGDITNFRADGVTFVGTNNAVSVKSLPSFVGTIANATFANFVLRGVKTAIAVNFLGQGGRQQDFHSAGGEATVPPPLRLGAGTMHGVRIVNVSGTTQDAGHITCTAGLPCTGIVMENVVLTEKTENKTWGKEGGAFGYDCANAEGRASASCTPQPCGWTPSSGGEFRGL